MIFQHTNHKRLMAIHNLQTKFRLLAAIIHTRDFKNIFLFIGKCTIEHKDFHSLAPCVWFRSFNSMSIHSVGSPIVILVLA